MRTLLICHEGAALDREGLARWLGSFSTFTGTVVIREERGRIRRRIAREVRRVGWRRVVDVLAVRARDRGVHAAADRGGGRHGVGGPRAPYPDQPHPPAPVVSRPNAPEAQAV